jgi:hypothetical protein
MAMDLFLGGLANGPSSWHPRIRWREDAVVGELDGLVVRQPLYAHGGGGGTMGGRWRMGT